MKLFFEIIIFFGFCYAKLLQPIGSNEIEILDINNKIREYSISRGNDLKYQVVGPKLVALNARKPIPRRYNGKIEVEFTIHLEGSNSIYHYSENNISNLVKSKKHPAHAYSNSEQILINIPKGQHVLSFSSDKGPILFRLTTKKKLKRKKTEYISPINFNKPIKITTGSRFKEFSILKSKETEIFNLIDEGLFWLYLRGVHNNDKIIPIILNYNTSEKSGFQKIIFFSEPSPITKADGFRKKIGKLRTFPIPLLNDFNKLIIENLSEIDVLIHGGLINDE